MPLHERHTTGHAERMRTTDHFVKTHAKRIDIGACIQRFSAQMFRRHVTRRTSNFVAMFIATFFNVAFYHEILAALSGRPVSIGRGLKFACTRLKPILMWTLFAGLVGLIIKAIEQRLELFGRLVARVIGVAWSVAAVFVIPIIIREEQSANPVNMLRKSAGVLPGNRKGRADSSTFPLPLCGLIITHNFWVF